MNKSEYRRQLKTLKWKAFRKKMLDILGRQCVICGTDKRLQVHHKRYIDGRKAWEYHSRHIAIMCHSDHKKYHMEHAIEFYDTNLRLKYRKKI